jgi:hypothetical protein
MLVSHRYKFIFAKAKKVASTTTESYLERYCVHPDDEENYIHQPESDYRISESGIIGSRMRGDKGSKKWFNHKPAVSIKKDLGDDIWNSYFKIVNIRNPYDLTVSLYHDTGHNSKNPIDFENFLREDRFKNILISNKDIWSLNGEFVFDYYLRQEFLEKDILKMMKELNIPIYKDKLPTYKKIDREHYSIYYNEISKEIISQIYDKELKMFNYTFQSE